jgi:hypothetical protein
MTIEERITYMTIEEKITYMTIEEKITAKYYENTLPYPDQKKIKDELSATIKLKPATTIASVKEGLAIAEKELEDTVKKEYRKQMGEYNTKEYNTKGKELLEEFRKDVEDECGTTNAPKKDKLWDIVWTDAHHGGFCAVYAKYSEYCELIL